jgi:hypothetical protein
MDRAASKPGRIPFRPGDLGIAVGVRQPNGTIIVRLHAASAMSGELC